MVLTPIIKRNPIYSNLHSRIYEQELNITILVIGSVGVGKSTAALKLATDLDPSFNIERVVYSMKDFMRLANEGDSRGKLVRGMAIIFDEIAGSREGADARNALTEVNKTISYFTTISRARGLIIFYVTPLLEQLDKRLRLIGVTGILNMLYIDRSKKQSIGKFYWNSYRRISFPKTLSKLSILHHSRKRP